VSKVYIIVNTWVDTANSGGSEVVDSKYFRAMEGAGGAWEALRDIAHAHDDDIDYDATNITFENHKPHLQYEEFYIQELTRG